MQHVLKEITSATKKLTLCEHGNLIALQELGEKMKPFVSLKLLRAGSDAKISQAALMPASGQAIITYLIAGQAIYSDSTGKRGALTQDGWSWVISGAGVVSKLEPITSDYLAIQLCIALTPAMENSLPQSAYLNADEMEREGPAQVLIGWHGNHRGKFALPSLMNYVVVHLKARQTWHYEVSTNHHFAWVFLVGGGLATAEGEVTANKITILNRTSEKIRLCATADAVFVIGSSQDFMHDLIFQKNSVHTSREALQLSLETLADLEESLV